MVKAKDEDLWQTYRVGHDGRNYLEPFLIWVWQVVAKWFQSLGRVTQLITNVHQCTGDKVYGCQRQGEHGLKCKVKIVRESETCKNPSVEGNLHATPIKQHKIQFAKNDWI